MKAIVLTMLLWVSIAAIGQTHFDLLPTNMRQYVGKVDRESFEQIVGPSVEESEGYVYYQVINQSDGVPTSIRCFFRVEDSILASCDFSTPHYLSYCIDFTMIEGYPKKQSEAEKKGLWYSRKGPFGHLYYVKMRFQGFGCQIYNMNRYKNTTTAYINYFIGN